VWCRLINMLYVRYKHSTIHDVLAHGLIPTTPSMGHLQASPSKMLTYCEYVLRSTQPPTLSKMENE